MVQVSSSSLVSLKADTLVAHWQSDHHSLDDKQKNDRIK